VATARTAAVSALGQVCSGQDEQAACGVDVPGLAASLGSIMCALHLGIDVHRWPIIHQAAPSKERGRLF
jgi:hypothetical protein